MDYLLVLIKDISVLCKQITVMIVSVVITLLDIPPALLMTSLQKIMQMMGRLIMVIDPLSKR